MRRLLKKTMLLAITLLITYSSFMNVRASESRVLRAGELKVDCYAVADNYYAGAEMEADDYGELNLYGEVWYEDVYGEVDTVSFSAGTGWGTNCHSYVRSGIRRYWDCDVYFYACDEEGNEGSLAIFNAN